jgi:hypothetical protein
MTLVVEFGRFAAAPSETTWCSGSPCFSCTATLSCTCTQGSGSRPRLLSRMVTGTSSPQNAFRAYCRALSKFLTARGISQRPQAYTPALT